MNINRARKIDKYIGPVLGILLLCLFFVVKLFRPIPKKKASNQVKEVIFIKFFGFGSILLAAPSIRLIKSHYTNSNISILTTTGNSQLCQMLQLFDQIYVTDIDSFQKFIISLSKSYIKILRTPPDIVVDLEFLTNFSAIVTLSLRLLCNISGSYGFNATKRWRNSIYDKAVVFDHSLHIVNSFKKIYLSIINIKTGGGPALSFSKEKKSLLSHQSSDAMKYIYQNNPGFRECTYLIAVNINAGNLCLLRRWPKSHFRELIDILTMNPRIGIILIGGPGEGAYVNGLMSEIGEHSRIVDISEKTSLESLTGLFVQCNLLISNDSGPLHLAFVLGTPSISLFGPETPRLYAPVGVEHRHLYSEIWCSPCINIYNSKMTNCFNNECMRSISPREVAKMVEFNYVRHAST
jgi:ADP-heptose:LPS heptosyltransferase